MVEAANRAPMQVPTWMGALLGWAHALLGTCTGCAQQVRSTGCSPELVFVTVRQRTGCFSVSQRRTVCILCRWVCLNVVIRRCQLSAKLPLQRLCVSVSARVHGDLDFPLHNSYMGAGALLPSRRFPRQAVETGDDPSGPEAEELLSL